MKKVLTIAGTDPTGGAGVQADLKTMTAHKVYGMSIITALVAQNTLGVRDIMEVKPDFLAEQFDCVFEDIYPDAIKIGMVSSPVLIEMIVNKLTSQKDCPIVVDPVMVSTSGSRLLADNALRLLKEKLIPLAEEIELFVRGARAQGKLWEEKLEDDAVEGETFHINDLVQEGEADD